MKYDKFSFIYRQLKLKLFYIKHLLGASRNLKPCDEISALKVLTSCHASVMDVDLEWQVKGLWFASRLKAFVRGEGLINYISAVRNIEV